ncbi:ATP-binding protein [Microbulbifer sp.]|uniref:ATP-binding protein n=1 Tax=Microbulbifer sp. TaxID=1908541 RepID=UPI002F927644
MGLDSGDGQILFYHRNGSNLLEIGPFPHQPEQSVTQWRMLFIGAMLVVLLLLIWPMFRDLNRLQKQAIRFSKKPFQIPERFNPRSTIYPLAETFRRMANIVTGHFEMHQDLARTIAHEIRTPLARIKFQQALSGGDALELTDAFTRSATDQQGYGLGLYIVKKVMMWHEGELRLDQSPNLGGTRATLRWPNRN